MAQEDVFDTAHHAATPGRKALRSAQLGAAYYLRGVPKYLAARGRLGLPRWDGDVLVNPVRELRRRTYTRFELPAGYRDALRALGDAGVRLTMPRMRLEALLGVWWAARRTPGDVIECGAYQGGTALLLAALAAHNGLDQRVLLADTFAGIPAVSAFDPLREGGEYGDVPNLTGRILEQAGRLGVTDRVELHVGLFADTLPAVATARPDLMFAFAHVDANVYEGTKDACRFVIPRLAPGAYVVFDDYNGVLDLGARLAIDECLAGTGHSLRPLAWCSAFTQTPDARANGR